MVSELLMLMGNLLFSLESSFRISTSSHRPELSHHPEQGRNNHFHHWVRKTEAQRGQMTCLRSHSKSVAEPSFPLNSLAITGSFLECLLCARHCAKILPCISSCDPQFNTWREVLSLASYYRLKKNEVLRSYTQFCEY